MEIIEVTQKKFVMAKVEYRRDDGRKITVELLGEDNGEYRFLTGESEVTKDFGTVQKFVEELEKSK